MLTECLLWEQLGSWVCHSLLMACPSLPVPCPSLPVPCPHPLGAGHSGICSPANAALAQAASEPRCQAGHGDPDTGWHRVRFLFLALTQGGNSSGSVTPHAGDTAAAETSALSLGLHQHKAAPPARGNVVTGVLSAGQHLPPAADF